MLENQSIPRKAFRGSKIRQDRWLRNYKDSHNPNKPYEGKRFGLFDEYRPMVDDNTKQPIVPSDLFEGYLFKEGAVELLNTRYDVNELSFFRRFLDIWPYKRNVRNPPNFKSKEIKSATKQTIFSPFLALYLLFMSEAEIFARYLRTWSRLQPHISLKITNDMIKPDWIPGCNCSGCFGNCVRLADKYGLLPEVTVHELLESERKLPKYY